MEYVIAKAINTASRRLKIGDPVGPDDVLTPHTFDGLKSRGFIAPKQAEKPAPARFVPKAED